MTDPFKSQRFTSNLSPIRQESDRSANVSPSRSGHDLHDGGINYNQTTAYYSRSQSSATSGQPDLLNQQQFRSAGNLGQYAYQLGQQQQQHQRGATLPPSNLHSNYVNKELVKQLKSNVELLYKGTKILSHFALYPLKALRWQCQINSESYKFHLTPITLMPVFYNLNYHGYITLCKGCFSHAAFTGVMVILESVLGEVTSFEKNIDDVNSSKKLYGHLALKCLSSALTTPIFSAVIYESVQSGIVNETIGLSDLMRETYHRITGYKYNYRTRLIPFWSLIAPTAFFMVGKHFLVVSLNKVIGKLIQVSRSIFQENRKFYKMDESEKEIVEDPYLEALTELSSQVAATCLMYPVETVLYRLIVQGTRTIIDNTDTGLGVVPINTRYEGFIDCVQTISQTEGVLGFYKGLGAAVLETFICYSLLRLAKTISTRIYDAEWTTRSDAANFKSYMSTNTNSHQPPPPSITYSSQIDLLNNN